ncbi:MAG: PAS domain S-box protein [Planctomycetaceae bacterium]|nr:PAS domain S-box protein [Planctomycetaceae bacterium]
MIFDASLGADICVWAHIKHIEKNGLTSLIAQPCPAIVSYCKIYRRDLLDKLSPIHSPMACTAIYMKDYQGIRNRIAALSPCIAKSDEFDETKLVQYNVTFRALQRYLEDNNVELPPEETEFDHEESGLGFLFPMPGGLKENIEFYFGKMINVSKAEGTHAFDKLGIYAETPAEYLPVIFDVLSCDDGCNVGSAVARKRNIFEIDAMMNKKRNAATDDHRREYLNSLHRIYDQKLELPHFLREYRTPEEAYPEITEKEIENAFELLGKTNDEKQHVDCGACGSETCHTMARRIALGVNIPINCIAKTMEDAKNEREENLAAREKFAFLEKMREAEERTRIMLDTTPLGAQFWDKNLNVIDCNQETLRLFNVPDKQKYLENFYECFPEYQPDGSLSKEKSIEIIQKVFQDGYLRLEWMCQTLDGTPIPAEVTLVRVDYRGEPLVAAYTRDLREHKQMMREVDAAVAQLQAANQALKSAQLTMATMFEANPHINILFNSNLEVIDCNPAAVQFTGFESKEEFLAGFVERIGKNTQEFQSEEESFHAIHKRLSTAADKGYLRFETEILLGGMKRSMNVVLKRIPYEDSFAIVAYVFDTTDIRERERELVQVREVNELQLTKLNLVVQATKIGLWEMEIVNDDLTNPANVFLWSDEFRHMLGFTDETDFPNVLGSWSERLHPEDKETTLEHAVKHLMDKTGKTPYDKEYRLLKKNGEYGHFRAYGGTARDKHGNALRIAGALMDITETKNTLINNELQLTKLNLAVQAAKIGLWEMTVVQDDPVNPGNAFLWSDEFRQLLGFSNETDFPNVLHSWSDRLHPEEKERTLDGFRKHLLDLTGKTPYDVEYRLLKKNGEYAYYRASGETIRDADGNALRVAGALMDITEAKKMTEALNRAVDESRRTIDVMANVLNNSDGMIYVSDKETGEILFVNDSLKRHFGIGDEVIGQHCYQVFQNGKEGKCEECPCHQLDNEPDKVLVWEERNSLTKRYYRNTDRYIDWHDGQKVHIQHRVDLTDIKEMSVQLEVALEQANVAGNELMLQKATLQTIIDSIPDLVFCKDMDFRYTLLNTACIDYLNIDVGDILGKNDYELNFPREVAEKLLAADQKIFAGEQRVVDNDWIPSFDGEARYLETTKAPLLQDKAIVGLVGVSRDITERMQMEKMLEAALAQAEAANKAKTEFLSKMSHEIRTPMNAILGITEIQLRNESLAPETKEALDKVYSAGDLLLGIINDVLDLSKIEAGKLELAPEKYDVASLVNDVVTLNMMRIGSKEIEFHLAVDENVPATLFGDELRIKQVLNNILSNAIKYTVKGAVELTVFVETKNGDDVTLIFEVRDTGLGMTEEQVSQMFEAYTRFNMKANRATEGTGLGMNITRNLVQLMNGGIFVKSKLNQGSVFTIRLPQQKIGLSILGQELVENLRNFRTTGIKQIKRAQVVFEQMPGGRVLVVDDVESNLYVATGLLTPYGLSIDTVTSGYAAIDKIKKGHKYDIIFMDHMMPEMDGIEATQIIRSMGYDHPVVALTANALAGQSNTFLENGFDDFVSKPVDVRQLNAVLKKFVRDKQMHKTTGATKWKTDGEEKQASETVVDPQLAEFFVRDATKSIAILNGVQEKQGFCDEKDLRMYTIHAHGIKTALANIGKMELAALANELETAGRARDTEVLFSKTPVFLGSLRTLVEELTPKAETEDAEMTQEDLAYLRESLLAIQTACESYDEKTADDRIVKLREKAWNAPAKKLLDTIAKSLLHSDFEEIVEMVSEFLEN